MAERSDHSATISFLLVFLVACCIYPVALNDLPGSLVKCEQLIMEAFSFTFAVLLVRIALLLELIICAIDANKGSGSKEKVSNPKENSPSPARSFIQREQLIIPTDIEQSQPRTSVQPTVRVVHARECVDEISSFVKMLRIFKISSGHRKEIISRGLHEGPIWRYYLQLLQGFPCF